MTFPHKLSSWEGRSIEQWRALWQLPGLCILGHTGSTNDDARSLGEQGAPSGTTVIAERQTAGRGRRGRYWHGTTGQSLHLSMLVRPQADRFTSIGAAPVRAGVAIVRALNDRFKLAAGLKWPNDLQVNGRKLGGILCESVLGRQPFLVIGIGINVTQSINDFPEALRPGATSLTLAAAVAIHLADAAGVVVGALQAEAATIANPFSAAELEHLASVDVLLGKRIEIDGIAAGTAIGIGADGALLVSQDHRVREVLSGTVRLAPAIS